MVKIEIVTAANAAMAHDTKDTRPFVAVFSGGTAGIGAYSVRALATTFGPGATRNLRVYIVGRNAAAADTLIKECSSVCPSGTFIFVEARDLSLISDVDRVTSEIRHTEERASQKEKHSPLIDLFVTSQGVLSFSAPVETAEGLDKIGVLFYYGRMRMVDQLVDMLTGKGPTGLHRGAVISVLNPKLGGAVKENDLGLREPANQGVFARGSQYSSFTTLYLQALASQYDDRLALAHYYPGYVESDLMKNSPVPGWLKGLWYVLGFAAKLMAVPGPECGQRVVYIAGGARPDTQDVKGAHRWEWNNEELAPPKATANEDPELARRVYEYTQRVFSAVEAGKELPKE